MPAQVPVLHEMELVPVIDEQYVEACADGGAPMSSISGFMPTRDLHEAEALRRLMTVEFRERGVSADHIDPDSLQTALVGGYILRTGAEIVVEPNCCSDLDTIRSWVSAAVYREDAWQELWIGHPCVSVRYTGDLIFSELHEPGDGLPPTAQFAVPVPVLERAVKQAIAELQSWARSMSLVLQQMTSAADANEIAGRLSGSASLDVSRFSTGHA